MSFISMGLSIVWPSDSYVGLGPVDHPHHLALRGLGGRLGWALQEGTQGLYPPACGCGQVHEVDRVQDDRQTHVVGGRNLLP